MTGTPHVVTFLIAIVLISAPAIAFAQTGVEGMRQTTSGGSLDIMLEPTWEPDRRAKFKVSFLDPKTGQLHEHQDYDFVIRQGDSQIFSAAAQLNQPLIHNQNGVITVPFTFLLNGDYTVEMQVLGLGFPPIPINPETASFPIQIIPEFPAGLAGSLAAAIASSIVLARRLKLF